MLYNFAVTVSYNGAAFSGFQLQDGEPTVQYELEKAFGLLLKHPVRFSVSGRTDAGVHATGQVAGFTIEEKDLQPAVISRFIENLPSFRKSVNAVLPRTVSVDHLNLMPPDFHVRFSCMAREYEYLIWNSSTKPVHFSESLLWFRHPIDTESLNLEMQKILGERDFQAFTRADYIEENTVRYLDTLELSVKNDLFRPPDGNLISFRVRGNAFLHNMIRIITGTILDKTKGLIQDSFEDILLSKDRLRAGHTALAAGLFFRKAYYSRRFTEGTSLHPAPEGYPVFRKTVSLRTADPETDRNPDEPFQK